MSRPRKTYWRLIWKQRLSNWLTQTTRRRRIRRPIRSNNAPAAECLEVRTLLSAGALDPTFGGDGTVLTDIGDPGTNDSGQDVVAYQSDGKSIVVGEADNEMVVLRYNTDGSLDTTFGTDGIAQIEPGSTWNAFGVAIDSQDRVIVGGRTAQGTTGFDFAVARLTANGELDTTFAGDGTQTVDFDGSNDYGYSVAVDSADRVVIAGYSEQGGTTGRDFAVARLTTAGVLDTSFDGDGRQTVDFGDTPDLGIGVTIDATDRVLLAGRVSPNSGGSDFAVARLTTNGSLDLSFGAGGKQTIDFGGTISTAYEVVVDSAGRVLLGGRSSQGATATDFAVARLTTSGVLDTSFNGNGKKTVDFGLTEDWGTSVALDNQGRVLLTGFTEQLGSTGTDFGVARLTDTGQLDTSFDSDGKQTVDFGDTYDASFGVSVDSADRLLLAGYVRLINNEFDIALARLTSNGTLDTTFDDDGRVLTDVGLAGTHDSGKDVAAFQSDGKLIVVGDSQGDMIAVRYNEDGTVDSTFGIDGIARIDFGESDDVALSVVVDSMDRILVAGHSNQGKPKGVDFAVARLTADGHLDTSFDGDGKQTIHFGTSDLGQSVTVDSLDRVLVAGSTFSRGTTRSNDFAVARLTTSGQLDVTFDGDGKQTIDFGGDSDLGHSVAVDSADRVLVAGTTEEEAKAGGSNFSVTRLTTSGALDLSFNGTGLQTIDIDGADDFGHSVAVDSGDRVIIAGTSEAEFSISSGDFAVVRLTTSGALDTSFDGDGKQTVDFGSVDDGQSVAVDSADRILVAGSTDKGKLAPDGNFAVARLTTSGQLDSNFDGDGKQTVDFGDGSKKNGTEDFGYGVAVDPAGRILIAGTSVPRNLKTGSVDFAVARLLANEPPTVEADQSSVTVDEGDTATNSGTYSDPGDTVTLRASIGTLTDDGDGTWSWSFDSSDGPEDSQTVEITATDSSGESTSITFELTVNNVAPTLADTSFDVVENSADGTPVGTVTGSDPGDDTLTYSITGGSGATAFAIDLSTGEITVADSAQLDFETTPVFTLEITVTDDEGETGIGTVTINLLNQASITGTVFVDTNENGLYEANEMGIDGVTVELLDSTGTVVETAVTSDGGFYLFEDYDPGTYQIREVQPTGVSDGDESLGNLGGTVVSNDVMEVTLDRTDAEDYDFAEIGQSISSGDTATIGFWQNKHGQALIEQGGTALATWLGDNFGNVFGNEFDGVDGEAVADFYKDQLFKTKAKKSAGPAKVDAQFMAVALATYFTSSNLAGTAAADYGFNVTDTGIGTKIVNVGSGGDAFNVDDDTELTIMQLLLATNALTDQPDMLSGFAYIYDTNGDGVIDSAEAALRSMANDIFSLINEQGDI